MPTWCGTSPKIRVFQNNGKFDRVKFEQFLRNVGYSEQRFLSEQRRIMLRRQIVNSLTGDLPVPKAWLEAINEFQNQERSIEYVTLGPAQAGDIPEPTADELSKYFEARKILFRAPEYRKIAIVQATPAEIAKSMEISDADLKSYFDDHRNRYMTPERRHVEQIVFPNAAGGRRRSSQAQGGLEFRGACRRAWLERSGHRSRYRAENRDHRPCRRRRRILTQGGRSQPAN